jgi:nuclear transport factor 2 (NTF2) superfamily protein
MFNEEDLQTIYDAFNRRDIDSVLSAMHPEVSWPNGMEGGYVYGHKSVRDYWTRQWKLIDPNVKPVRFQSDKSGRIIVDVHQVVRDLNGDILNDQIVKHVYQIQDGLIRSMDIRKP